MNINKIIESNLHLLDNDKNDDFIDKCWTDFLDVHVNKKPYLLRDVFDFGIEVVEASLDYRMNYELYNE